MLFGLLRKKKEVKFELEKPNAPKYKRKNQVVITDIVVTPKGEEPMTFSAEPIGPRKTWLTWSYTRRDEIMVLNLTYHSKGEVVKTRLDNIPGRELKIIVTGREIRTITVKND